MNLISYVEQACAEFLELAQSHGQKWQKMLQHEQDQRQRLEEIIEQLARQQNILEQAAKTHQMQASKSVFEIIHL
jgi:mRNA-degrading endonuclease YafQ of YafQ-DinJ toxin-antitoxin module